MSTLESGGGSLLERRTRDELVLAFEDVGIADVPRVGGKNASLGELTRALAAAGVAVPAGFATTSYAYRLYLDVNGIREQLESRVSAYRAGTASLRDTGAAIRELILGGEFPPEMVSALSICGQGPSNHPDFAQFLVDQGIDSISLNPDSFLRTVPLIAAAESELRD